MGEEMYDCLGKTRKEVGTNGMKDAKFQAVEESVIVSRVVSGAGLLAVVHHGNGSSWHLSRFFPPSFPLIAPIVVNSSGRILEEI